MTLLMEISITVAQLTEFILHLYYFYCQIQMEALLTMYKQDNNSMLM